MRRRRAARHVFLRPLRDGRRVRGLSPLGPRATSIGVRFAAALRDGAAEVPSPLQGERQARLPRYRGLRGRRAGRRKVGGRQTKNQGEFI